jgi:hypothetical protein
VVEKEQNLLCVSLNTFQGNNCAHVLSFNATQYEEFILSMMTSIKPTAG